MNLLSGRSPNNSWIQCPDIVCLCPGHRMRCEDFWDQLKGDQIYLESVRLHVRQALGATEVFVMPHIVETLSTTDICIAHSTHVAIHDGKGTPFSRSLRWRNTNSNSLQTWQILGCLYDTSPIYPIANPRKHAVFVPTRSSFEILAGESVNLGKAWPNQPCDHRSISTTVFRKS